MQKSASLTLTWILDPHWNLILLEAWEYLHIQQQGSLLEASLLQYRVLKSLIIAEDLVFHNIICNLKVYAEL